MANFKTHVGGAGLVGLAYVGVSVYAGVPFTWNVAGLLLATTWLGGILPDMDHDTSQSLVEIIGIISSTLPLLLFLPNADAVLAVVIPAHIVLHLVLRQVPYLEKATGPWAMARVVIVALAIGLVFIWLRRPEEFKRLSLTVLAAVVLIQIALPIFKEITVHRGLFHTIPAMIAAGAGLYLVLDGEYRLWAAGGLTLGGLTHLTLDEIFAVDWSNQRLKKSFGTALSVWQPDQPLGSAALWVLCAALIVRGIGWG
ncbi:metal-dependent hydrolase [Myxococcota bacterium]|nr:metal-dependent hydrolase [Myxococcota bacterium]MBU1432006.1 metal-dependent hydrolase [Myxococcota bacterium]MBU1896176.1 metal-dependent hydrolase [Myxococcota bacterium]